MNSQPWRVDHSIMLNVTWRHFDQSAKQLIVGHTTIQHGNNMTHYWCSKMTTATVVIATNQDPIQSNSSMHHYECIALCKDISIQRGRFCTRSLASYITRSSKNRSIWTVNIDLCFSPLTLWYTNTGPVHHEVCLFTSQLLPVLNYTAW